MGVLKKAKKKVKKENQDKINLFQVKNFLDLNNAKELPKICAVMALSGVCKHFEVEFKITGITNENLLKGNAKIQKLTEKNTLWCTFELEEIIKRSFGTLTRIIEEFHYEELHTRITEKFKNYFVMDFFGKLYFEEKEKIKLKYKHQLKTKYNDTKRALKGIIEILACYGLFKKFISEKMDEISKKNRMYIKTLITKTDKKFKEIEKVIKEGERENFEKDMLELLKFEEAGFDVKWIGYSRKQALKLRKSRKNA